jgi:rSAM/selenodomain-associated transferase 1
MRKESALVMLAKAPDAKTVKTRLKGRMNDEERVGLYTSLLEGTIKRLRDIPGVDSYICFAPSSAGGYFDSFGLGAFPQCGGDLGERMHDALKKVLLDGYSSAALVGVDVPDLTADAVLYALGLLDNSDIVFGPSPDGGYYLVGLKAPIREIFHDVRWSSPDTLRQSIIRAEESGYVAALAGELSDVDTIEDVMRYKGRDG